MVAIDSHSVRWSTGVRSDEVSLASFDHVEVTRKWYGTSLRVIGRGDAPMTPWPRLAHAGAETIAAGIRAAQHGPVCDRARVAFEHMLAAPGYVNHKKVRAWLDEYSALWLRICDFPPMLAHLQSNSLFANACDSFRSYYSGWEHIISTRNEQYVHATSNDYANFFTSLESNPLNHRQIEAVLRDEDNTLVVAGAGTGKTSTVVGKIGFLIESCTVKPEEVLALAFTRKAKEEIQHRTIAGTGHEVAVQTFHSLGLQIVNAVEGEKVAIAILATHERELLAWVSSCLSELIAAPEFRERYVRLAVYDRHPSKYLDDFSSNVEYLRYMRKTEPQTLRGERVKSFEELLIADWLTINGVRYKYEAPYEHDTASRHRRQYKPDFYLPDFGLYLEHFGINRDGSTASGIDQVTYADGIRWKRALHRLHRTSLVETYSYERKEGILLHELERKLKAAGVVFAPPSDEELRNIVEHPGVKKPLVALLKDFLNVFKANLWAITEVRAQATASANAVRANAFLDLFEVIYDRYQAHLATRRERDFSDLIARATKYVESGAYRSPFTRIVVDEFQDISRGRQRLLISLTQQADDCRTFCVGDDWQSIFGFAGSDVQIMTRFSDIFGYSARTDLDRTFRFNEELLRVSSGFIQKNPMQLSKQLVAQTQRNAAVVHILDDGPDALNAAFDRVDELRTPGKRASVMLLGRYNFSEPEGWRTTAEQHPRLDVRYLTVHKAKGLEADFVVLLDMRSGRYGFPSEVASDPIMALVVPSDDGFDYAEERRLFYVALTRARHAVFILSETARPSLFVEELLAGEYGADVEQHERVPMKASKPVLSEAAPRSPFPPPHAQTPRA
jgi:DNA helicase IV